MWGRRGLRAAWEAAVRRGLLPAPALADRRILERIIFPHYLADPQIRAVLFVGCDWYTRHYERSHFAGLDYWTLEPCAARRKHGARQHVIAPLEDLERHFPVERFDWIICNGVYGWGLDEPARCEQAFAACHSRLRRGGHLLLGWNDLPGRDPAPLAALASLARFAAHPCAPLGSWRYETGTPHRHIYAFLRRSEGTALPSSLRGVIESSPEGGDPNSILRRVSSGDSAS
jgi:hypothetical protein